MIMKIIEHPENRVESIYYLPYRLRHRSRRPYEILARFEDWLHRLNSPAIWQAELRRRCDLPHGI